MQRISIAVAVLPVLAGAFPSEVSAQSSAVSCTQVIGFSQVGQTNGGWYVTGGAFESQVVDDEWQSLWQNGVGVDRWKSPDYAGWSADLVSPCAAGSESPDRVVFSISGPYVDDVPGWQAHSESAAPAYPSRAPPRGDLLV